MSLPMAATGPLNEITLSFHTPKPPETAPPAINPLFVAPSAPTDSGVAYARFPERQPGEYRDGWLPNES